MKTLFFILFICLTTISYASQKAITDTGEEIIIYSDGKWEYPTKSKLNEGAINYNKSIFKRPKDSSFLLKSTKNDTAYWLNTNKWSFSKPKDSTSAAEYKFQLKDTDLYGMTITERIEMPIENLADIALSNLKDAAPDGRILKKEYRTVNGNKVLYMEIGGILEGVNFTYLGYYYSDTSGTTQFVTFTSANLVDKYKSEINDFLNGFVTQ